MRIPKAAWLGAPWITLLCRLVVGGVFVLASLHKLMDPDAFAQAVYNYKLLPGSLINAAAILLPWVELLAGLTLILGIKTRGAALILSGLMAVFATALGINLSRGLDISCGCFSAGEGKITALYLARDLGLLLAALQVLLFDRGLYRVVPFKSGARG